MPSVDGRGGGGVGVEPVDFAFDSKARKGESERAKLRTVGTTQALTAPRKRIYGTGEPNGDGDAAKLVAGTSQASDEEDALAVIAAATADLGLGAGGSDSDNVHTGVSGSSAGGSVGSIGIPPVGSGPNKATAAPVRRRRSSLDSQMGRKRESLLGNDDDMGAGAERASGQTMKVALEPGLTGTRTQNEAVNAAA